MRRLEAEPLRDSVLAVSGRLDTSLYGSPPPVRRLKNGEVVVGDIAKPQRRSIYVQVLRLNPETILEVFDQPEMAVNCTQRRHSTVPTQALSLLNSDMMIKSAQAFADRVVRETGLSRSANDFDDPDYQRHVVRHAVQLAYSRQADQRECETLVQFLTAQAGRHRLAITAGDKRQSPETAAGKPAVKKTTAAGTNGAAAVAARAKNKQQTKRAFQLALADLCHVLITANEFTYID